MAAHSPLMMAALGLLPGRLNLLAIGLLGEMQVRHYHEPSRRAPYSVDRVLRSQNEEHSVSGITTSILVTNQAESRDARQLSLDGVCTLHYCHLAAGFPSRSQTI